MTQSRALGVFSASALTRADAREPLTARNAFALHFASPTGGEAKYFVYGRFQFFFPNITA
jgi:hypothetical protein